MERAIIAANLKEILLQKDFKISLHSRFNTTVNFLINNKIIAFQNESNPLTPFAVKLVNYDKQINEITELDVNEILLNNHKQYLDLKVIPLENFDRKSFKEMLSIFLKQKIGKSQIVDSLFISKDDNPFTRILKKDLIINLENLIGLGVGLTPAGDDFVIGYVLGLIIQNKFSDDIKNNLVIAINKPGATNEISKQYLMAALDQNFNQYVYEMFKNFNQLKINSSFEKIGAIGASSGLDLLAGLYISIN